MQEGRRTDGRTTGHAGYVISQRRRKRIEEVFGWIKSSAGLAKVKLRGTSARGRRLHPGACGGEFAFGCVTGALYGAGDSNTVAFSWDGNNEMDSAHGDGWAELRPDGSIKGQICLHHGDEATFTARPSTTSSTAW